ncbi:MAG: SMC family ATPase [Cyanobacteria bacterium Co-bin8]|nr:SMC family ATPase [Cyanobacteria bacterium Co-bin8]
MQILSVTLKNFKTHRDRYFEFQPGTNAICGENGAGKTSLLEAIAWALFNHQGDYAKEDLIRNGSSSAQVTVAFISSRDQRTYEVQRCTQRGYTLYDPQLNERLPYTRIKDEVLPWLRQHLGVGPGTDLAQLFARTIGVPQGTFTADFLQTAENRKTVFDAILKVEEYKAAYKQMNSLRRYAENQVESVKQEIAQYEEALQALPDLQARQQAVAQEIQANQAQLQALELALADLQEQRSRLQAEAQKLQALSSQLQTLGSQIEGKTQVSARLRQSFEQAKQATAICEVNQAAYEQYQAAEAQLQALSQQQQARQTLQTQLRAVQKQAEKKQAVLTRLQVQLESLDSTAQELTRLQPLAQEQSQLEQQLNEVQQQLQALHPIRLQLQHLQQQSQQSQQQAVTLETALGRLQRLKPRVEEIAELEQQCDRIQQQLSRLEAARQFEQELQTLVTNSQTDISQYKTQADEALQTLASLQVTTPVLSATAVTALKSAIESGVALNHTLVSQVEEILQDLASQTDANSLHQRLQDSRKALEQRYQYRGELAQLPVQQQQLVVLKTQQQQWQTEQQALQARLQEGAPLQEKQRTLNQTLAALGNPKGQCQLLEKSLQDRSQLQTTYNQQSADQQAWQQQIADLETQLEAFADLDLQVAQQQTTKQAHWTGHSLYLQNQQAAGQQPQLLAELTATEQTIESLEQQRSHLQQDYTAQQTLFDPAALAAIEGQYGEMRSQADRLSGSLPQQQKLLAELEQQLAALQETAQKRNRAEQERLRRDRIKRFVNFARNAYKEAGPRISECYVQSISREADRLFRELLNRPNVALEWTRDYEILVQEGPDRRRFINLSGGEQMCAALAVRLALLKVLADIDIAFFDEPTTNMDRPRRESLAEAISRIKSFRQLFVISHDDTFEKVTENVILIERES